VLTFYLVVEQNAVKKIIKSFTPEERQELILQIYRRIQQRLGWWLRGQVILAFIIGFLAYIGLLILRVDYPAILALVAGVTEIIPYLGPIVGAIPAVFIAFFQSPVKALLVIILYYIIQWTENNVIVPKVMQKATGLNPIVVIVAIMIGAKVAGIFGVLLAVPVATALNIVVEEYLAWQKEQSQA
jgi:predicted PurR-regulated permease PerM